MSISANCISCRAPALVGRDAKMPDLLILIGTLTLTSFQLGHWMVALWESRQLVKVGLATSSEEIALERKARDLEKQKRKLEEQTAKQIGKPATALAALEPERVASGLGADLQPVPEPQVRDHSFPQPKPIGHCCKSSHVYGFYLSFA